IPPIKNLIQKLNECREEEIPGIVESAIDWSYPRGDLFHWIGVLNRFDTMLENICKNYNLKKLQTSKFSEGVRIVLVAILKFSRVLLENCTNRNLYSSYEHLNDLLYTSDLDVLEVLLRLILRPAQRLSNQRALRTNFTISPERILTLAHSWGTKEYDLEMEQLASDDVTIPEELTTLNYQFYRHLTPSEAAETTVDKKSDVIPSTQSQKNQRKDSASSSGGTKTGEGVTLISINNVRQLGETDMNILNNVVQDYNIPEEFHFALLNRIRIVTSIPLTEARRRLLIIRLLAVAIMAHVIPEHVAQSKLFLYEPDIVANLAKLVHPDRNVPFDIQTVALYALDGISRYRSKLGEVLTAINASANHGILLYVLRREYYDALFALISYVITTQTGGTMVISAGIVPTLLQLLNNKNSHQLKNVTKAVGILDSLVYGFNTSFTSFCNANGVRILVDRIKEEVDNGIQLSKDARGDQMEGITIASTSTSAVPSSEVGEIPPNVIENEVSLPYERASLLKSMFKFVLHMMQASGTADGLRNLIDTSLPDSLKKVFEQPNPTSLPIMQEAKLPQTFLSSISKEIPASADVIQSIPNAFGAICLNSQGIDIFNEMNPIDKFFTIFTSNEHLRSLQDGDVASSLGNSIDELMRHHPSLKQSIMNAIMSTLQRIIELGHSSSIKDNTSILHAGSDDDQVIHSDSLVGEESIDTKMVDSESLKSDDKKENTVVAFIEIAARACILFQFLESLFQTQNHCKEFLKQEHGLNIILKFYALPVLPYEFGCSQASYSLSHLMRVIADVDSKRSISAIVGALNETLQGATNFLSYEGKGILSEYVDLKANDVTKIEEANNTFRTLITLHGYVGLLSDVYCTPVFSHSKSASSVIEAFIGNDNDVLPTLGKLHRVCVWENVVLKSSVPKSWYNLPSKTKKPSHFPESTSSLTSVLLDDTDKETADSNEPPVDQNDRKVKNAKCLKFLVSQIPSCLTPLFQGLAKMLFSRKSPDASQKKQAFKISDAIAEVLRDHLTWPRYGIDSETDSTNKYSYLTIMLGLLSLLFLDERSQVSLQTMLVVSFNRVEGLQFWDEAEGIKALEEYSTIEVDDGSKEKLSRIHGCIDVTLNFFQFVASSKLLHESPQTVPLITKDRDPRIEPFDSFDFLVTVRAKILPVTNELWQSAYLPRAPPNIVRSVLQNLVQILKADGEVNQRPEGSGSSSGLTAPSSTLFGATRSLVPDEERVQQLIDMGFSRSSAETALIRCNNHVQTATDYLLTHPQTIAATVFSAAPSSEASRNPSDTTPIRDNAPTDAGSTIDVTGTSGDDDDDVSDNEEDGSNELAQALALSMQGNQTPVEGATASEGSIPMDTETTSTKPDKGKGKEVDYIDSFKALREELRSTSASRAIELLDEVEDIIFEVKDLFVLLSKDDAEKNIELIIISIESARGHSDEQRKKALNSRLRLLALLLNENSIQIKIPNLPFKIFPEMISMISEEARLPLESPLPKWIAPALLVIEAFISLSEEPVSVELVTKPEESKDINVSSNELNFLTDQLRLQLLEYCLSLLRRKDLDKDIMNALLRIVVRLTRRYSDAVEFVNKDGLNLLFNAFKSRAHDFRGQQVFIVMILRHALEDASALESIIDKEIKSWFNNPRPRGGDISAYLRNNAQFALRAPEIFIRSTKKLCKLSRYDSSGRNQQIMLIKPETEDTITITANDTTINEDEMADVLPVPSTSVSLGSPKKISFGSETAEILVQFIANELVTTRLQANQTTLDPKQCETNSSDRNENINSFVTTTSSTNSTSTSQSTFKPEEHLDYLYRCFLLQCLTELLSSYPSCKIEVVNLSRRRNSMGTGTQSKSKISLLYYLLNELLPYGCITPSTDIEMRKRYGQSKWTTSALVALCSNVSSEIDEKKPQPEIIQVRKFVLDCIIKSFKTAISSSDPIETKYGRLLSLAELCYAILNSRTGPNSTANKPIDDGPASIAKIMLDKNFVNTLTDALSEVDLNYPSARILINALLKPFEFLTKVAIKLGQSPETPNKEQQRRD
ncbi:8932_t:CDS:10, partial [Scutellospora calospora]